MSTYALPGHRRGFCLCAQLIVIQDGDGYTNLRGRPGKQGQVVTRIRHGRVCMIKEEVAPHNPATDHWNRVSTGSCYAAGDTVGKPHPEPGEGYIHNSRYKFLDMLPALKPGPAGDSCRSFGDGSLRVEICTCPFLPREHHIKKKNGVVREIDGCFVWGMDGGVPTTAVAGITIQKAGRKWELPGRAFSGLYQPDPGRAHIYLAPDDCIYICMAGGDGAGAYNVVWTWKNNALLSTVIFDVP